MAKRSTIIAITAAVAVVAIGAVGAGFALAGSNSNDSAAGDQTTVTVRLWDEQVASAYEQSFAAFEAKNPTIKVDVTVVPWADYWTKLRTDIAGKSADDVFWVNNSYYADYADNGNLLNIDDALGTNAKDAWQPSVVDQFTRDGALWGVPQLSDAGIAVYYNTELLADAGIDPSSLENLTWSLDPATDTFLPVLKKLTKDGAGHTADEADFDAASVTQYGYNAGNDLQAMFLNYIGSNGGTFQDGDEFTFANPKTVEAFQYLTDLINRDHVAPSAADTNQNGDFSRDQFLHGKMALFQSGLYNLKNVADGASFDWGVASIPTGPAGRVSVTNGIVAAGNAASAHPAETQKVLEWLGSVDGNEFVGASGAAVPGVVAAQSAYTAVWEAQGVDTSKFFDVIANPTIPAPRGANFGAAYGAYGPILEDVFAARIPVAEGMQKAQDAANAALKK
ncbi:ABC transporter substrate-binding protein [Glaciibacter psychrotolerans]|uniref:Multiple sugar transport system substrate-binding protein n=1 Tax=Glaciibacter psychrotolerans TaxID=670054 RepID=A0A7Z0J6Y1_9MICO|nr:sugar ABC transporter substrate-binding protein [Leifsonia psychrotolerans]NYJ21022.1 multiple sugar transport system substrate-binding protein [Leifsonia psychrotolerans]